MSALQCLGRPKLFTDMGKTVICRSLERLSRLVQRTVTVKTRAEYPPDCIHWQALSWDEINDGLTQHETIGRRCILNSDEEILDVESQPQPRGKWDITVVKKALRIIESKEKSKLSSTLDKARRCLCRAFNTSNCRWKDNATDSRFRRRDVTCRLKHLEHRARHPVKVEYRPGQEGPTDNWASMEHGVDCGYYAPPFAYLISQQEFPRPIEHVPLCQ